MSQQRPVRASRSAKTFKGVVKATDGQVAGEISSAIRRIALPAGKYTLELGGRQIPIELIAGQDLEIKVD